MPFLKRSIIFSRVTGIVVDRGKPVPRVVVERRVKESGKEKVDTTTTDANGKFSFGALKKPFSFPKLFPHETVITQWINLSIMGKKYEAWICIKRNYDENSELDGKAIDIICDLDNAFQDNDGKFMGMCRLR